MPPDVARDQSKLIGFKTSFDQTGILDRLRGIFNQS
jgi:hypothetical protein